MMLQSKYNGHWSDSIKVRCWQAPILWKRKFKHNWTKCKI